jgi:hypothetical protein
VGLVEPPGSALQQFLGRARVYERLPGPMPRRLVATGACAAVALAVAGAGGVLAGGDWIGETAFFIRGGSWIGALVGGLHAVGLPLVALAAVALALLGWAAVRPTPAAVHVLPALLVVVALAVAAVWLAVLAAFAFQAAVWALLVVLAVTAPGRARRLVRRR